MSASLVSSGAPEGQSVVHSSLLAVAGNTWLVDASFEFLPLVITVSCL